MSAPRIRILDEDGKPARARELKTFTIAGIFNDDKGELIPAAGFTTLTLVLFDDATKQILNSVGPAPVTILNTGRGSVDANGNLVCTLLGDDNPILGSAGEELHVAFFQWTYAGGSKSGGIEAEFLVHNFTKLP